MPPRPERTPHAPGPTGCLLDIGPAVHQRAGLSRYAERLGANLAKLPREELSLAYFYNRHSGDEPPSSLRGSPAYTLAAGQHVWRLSALASQLSRTPYRPVESMLGAMQDGASTPLPVVYHATEHLLPRLTGPTVLTVHDLIFDRFPEYHTRTNRLFLKLGMPLFVRNSTLVIAVSENTRQDLIARYAIGADCVRVIHEGIDHDFAPAPEADLRRVRTKYAHDEPYLLMVGSIEPRKNHAAAIQALALLHQAGYPHRLLIAGGKGWMVEPILEEAERSAVRERISFLDFVPQDDLPALYSAAELFLLPSRYEGFGFTALEAMACGTPVVCSDAGSLPEITGAAALRVDPDDVEGLAQSIRNVLDQPRLAEAMVRLGLENAARFRWQICAQQTHDVYREAAQRHNT